MKYVIITPAYNEADYIRTTIETVLKQTIKPVIWIIVDDGSTDDTGQIIKDYAAQYPWICYVCRVKDPSQSYYSSNVYAIFEGIKQVSKQDYDYLAILDADISLIPDYYQQVLNRMEGDNRLGIASGVYVDRIGENKFRKILNDRRSVPKGIMICRKECYQEIGGFVPLKYGGEDTCACFTARMKNWKVWSFTDIVVVHNKPVGMGHAKNLLKIRFRQGIGEYFMATHPIFFVFKSLRRCIKESPVLLGGLCRMAGFVYAHFMGQPRQIPNELIRFIRAEQWTRVFNQNKIPSQFQIGSSK